MIDSAENRELLKGYLQSFDIDVDDERLSLLLKHLDLVVEKNKVLNLTRITDADSAIIRHTVDSLLLLPSLRFAGIDKGCSFVDIGTGAGFPGIPLAIATGCKGTLIDSVGKKATAVKEFAQVLDLNELINARAVRAEDLARDEGGSYSFATARAVADLGVLIEYATPLLSMDGYLIVSKARISDDEVVRGKKTANIVGMTMVSRETYELPKDSGHREILTFKRDRRSKIKLPRQTGMAKHKPLV